MSPMPPSHASKSTDRSQPPNARQPAGVADAGRPDARTEKVSVSLPTDLTSDVRSRVGSRGFSGYVARAVRRQIERDNLDALLADMEAANGPVPDDLLAAVEALWPANGAATHR